MIAWLRSHADALRDAVDRLLEAPFSAALSLLAIGIALALPAAGLVLIDNLRGLAGGLASNHEISVFMTADASRAEVAEVERRLKSAAAGEFRFVAKDAALKQLQGSEGLADLLAGLPRNPLPDAFVIRPASGGASEFSALAKTISGWPKVAHVQLDSAWVQRLDALARVGRVFVAVLATILGAGLIAVVFNTIRLQLLARREEVELSLLIGATRSFVARPFVWFGVIEGLLGALVALALVAGALTLITGPAGELIALYGGNFKLQALTPKIAAGVIAAGALLGWAAGLISTRGLAPD